MIRDLMRLRPLDVGAEAPPLSLTADDGTWIKLRDFNGHLNVVLAFFRTEDDNTERWLQALEAERERLEGMSTVVFAVHTNRTDRLREQRAALRLGYHLLFDPLALTARAFGASRRTLPFCKDTAYVIGKDQRVAQVWTGLPEPAEIAEVVARLEGVSLAQDEAASPERRSKARTPGQAAQVVQEIDSVTAESLLDEADSPFKLVDVRTHSEFEADHSPDAVRIQVDELPHRYQELGQVNHLVFVCQAGDRSAAAAEFMTSIGGHEIYTVVGGMSAWEGRRVTGDAVSGVSGGELT
ncbi:MAG: redoxin domain-containing protein [Alphaproteobacteria bacterium]|nr:redoxin domain-containing protein [Alphaproteobacteria bacterium]MCB9792597.1 redoxin domain-containing protein [Alphaproteobacteria bacterium]